MPSRRSSKACCRFRSFCTVECRRSSDRYWWQTWMHCRPVHRAFFSRQASWLERVSITRHSIRWCWPCPCPGRARCSSTLGGYIASTPARPTCGSSISLTPATRHCCECGKNGSAATGRWGTGSALMALPSDSEFFGRRLDFRQNPQQPVSVLISSGGQSALGQPSATIHKGSDSLRALFLAWNPRATRGSGHLCCGWSPAETPGIGHFLRQSRLYSPFGLRVGAVGAIEKSTTYTRRFSVNHGDQSAIEGQPGTGVGPHLALS